MIDMDKEGTERVYKVSSQSAAEVQGTHKRNAQLLITIMEGFGKKSLWRDPQENNKTI